MTEEWRKCRDYPDYEVSDQGRIRKGEKVLAGTVTNKGYRTFSVTYEGKTRIVQLHRQVLIAFTDEEKEVGRHLNRDTLDNRLCNLAWGSTADNYADSVKHGTNVKGERHGCSKLTNAAVKSIRALLVAGVSQRKIAAKFGVHQYTVYAIHVGKTWNHVN